MPTSPIGHRLESGDVQRPVPGEIGRSQVRVAQRRRRRKRVQVGGRRCNCCGPGRNEGDRKVRKGDRADIILWPNGSGELCLRRHNLCDSRSQSLWRVINFGAQKAWQGCSACVDACHAFLRNRIIGPLSRRSQLPVQNLAGASGPRVVAS